MGEETPAPELTAEKRRRWRVPLWLALVLMLAALAVSALILVRVLPPLYGLLFPADLPVPGGAREVEHVRPDKGAEYWIYRTTMTGAEVAAFYEEDGGTCQYAPKPVNPDDPGDTGGIRAVAQCQGHKETGGFGLSYEVYIHEGYPADEGPTIFRIYKYSTR